ncbi:MAG: AAA family ATPase [Actinobacteria bacterium]|nr:AAA family ATPase [Actinomycetota bacterium]
MLASIFGKGESGKTWAAIHTGLDVVRASGPVLYCDGQMSAGVLRRRVQALGATPAELAHFHYCELTGTASDPEAVDERVTELGVRLIVWDSALSLISQTAHSENDNAAVTVVYDKLRSIVGCRNVGGLIIDHIANGSIARLPGELTARAASAKFNSMDLAYGAQLAPGSTPSPTGKWSTHIGVSKDRHGLLPSRHGYLATYLPMPNGNLQIDMDRITGPVAASDLDRTDELLGQIRALDPAARSANEAVRRLPGYRRADVLAAYKLCRGGG